MASPILLQATLTTNRTNSKPSNSSELTSALIRKKPLSSSSVISSSHLDTNNLLRVTASRITNRTSILSSPIPTFSTTNDGSEKDSFYLHKSANSSESFTARNKHISSIDFSNEDIDEIPNASETDSNIRILSSSSSSNSPRSSILNDEYKSNSEKNSVKQKKRVSFNENLLQVHLIPNNASNKDEEKSEDDKESPNNAKYQSVHTNGFLAAAKGFGSRLYRTTRPLKVIESDTQISSDIKKHLRQTRQIHANSPNLKASITTLQKPQQQNEAPITTQSVDTNNIPKFKKEYPIKSINFNDPMATNSKSAMIFDPLTFKQRTIIADKPYTNSSSASISLSLSAQSQNHINSANSFATKLQHYIHPQFYSRLIDSTSTGQISQNSIYQTANNTEPEIQSNSSNSIENSEETALKIANKRLRSKLNGTQIKEVWKEINSQKRAANELVKYDDENANQQAQAVLLIGSVNSTSTPRNSNETTAHRITFSDEKSNSDLNPHTKAKYHVVNPSASNDFTKMNQRNLTTSQIHTINSIKHFSTKNNNGNNGSNSGSENNRRTPENRVNLNRNLTFRIKPTTQSPLGAVDLRRTHSALPILLRSANGTASIISMRTKNIKPVISINSPQGHYVSTSKSVQGNSFIRSSSPSLQQQHISVLKQNMVNSKK